MQTIVRSRILYPWTHEPRSGKVKIPHSRTTKECMNVDQLYIAEPNAGIIRLIIGFVDIRSTSGICSLVSVQSKKSIIYALRINFHKKWPWVTVGNSEWPTRRIFVAFGAIKPLKTRVEFKLAHRGDAASAFHRFASIIPVYADSRNISPSTMLDCNIEHICRCALDLSRNSKKEEFELLWRRLMSTPKIRSNEKKILWLKAAIMLDALRLRGHDINRKRLFILRKIYNDIGHPKQFSSFLKLTQEKLAPHIIGPHGYRVAPSNVDQTTLFGEIAEFIEISNKLSFPIFINSGTLLGIYRDGKLIDHDDDMDLAIFLGECNIESAANKFRSFQSEINRFYDLISKNNDVFFALTLKSGVEVDIFPSWSENNKFFVYPYMFGELETSEVIPLVSINYSGREISVPRNADAVLAVNYGENWRNPDPLWAFDWPRSRSRFSKFLKEMGNNK